MHTAWTTSVTQENTTAFSIFMLSIQALWKRIREADTNVKICKVYLLNFLCLLCDPTSPCRNGSLCDGESSGNMITERTISPLNYNFAHSTVIFVLATPDHAIRICTKTDSLIMMRKMYWFWRNTWNKVLSRYMAAPRLLQSSVCDSSPRSHSEAQFLPYVPDCAWSFCLDLLCFLSFAK